MARMDAEAHALGADGVVGVRLHVRAQEWGADISEFVAIGTAVISEGTRYPGMDWHDIHDVLAKVREEMDEVEGALANNDTDAAASELGDMLLALANAPRFIDHSAEETLRRACDKFTQRFSTVERIAASRGLELKRLRPEEIDTLWDEAKRESAVK